MDQKPGDKETLGCQRDLKNCILFIKTRYCSVVDSNVYLVVHISSVRSSEMAVYYDTTRNLVVLHKQMTTNFTRTS